MSLFPRPVYTVPHMPSRSLGTLPTGNPSVQGSAQGRIPEYGTVSVEVSGACAVTIYFWSTASGSWVNPGSSSAAYQKTFTAAGFDFFTGPPGARFYIKSDTGAITGYTDGTEV